MLAGWDARADEDEIDSPIFFLEVPWEIFPALGVLSPGQVVPPRARPSGPETTRPVVIVAAGSLGVVILGHTVGEGAALPGGVVRILMPWTLAIQEPVQVFLIEGGAELTITEMISRDALFFFQGWVQMFPAPTTGAGYSSNSPAPGNASSGAGDGTTHP